MRVLKPIAVIGGMTAALVAWTGAFAEESFVSLGDALRDAYIRVLDDPENPRLNLIYGDLARQAGRMPQARLAYGRVLAADPDNRNAAAGIAVLDAAFGRSGEIAAGTGVKVRKAPPAASFAGPY